MTLRNEDNPFIPGRCATHPMLPLQFKRHFGMTCEETFKDRTIDAAYFRKKLEDL